MPPRSARPAKAAEPAQGLEQTLAALAKQHVPHEAMREAALTALSMAHDATQHMPSWNGRLFGFGPRMIRYASGRTTIVHEVSVAISSSKVTFHLSCDKSVAQRLKELPQALGKVTHGVGCLHIATFADIKPGMLSLLLSQSSKDAIAWEERCAAPVTTAKPAAARRAAAKTAAKKPKTPVAKKASKAPTKAKAATKLAAAGKRKTKS